MVTRIGAISFAKFQALLGTHIGLIFGIIYSLGGLIIDILVTIGWVTSQETPGLSYGTILAFGALVGMPVIGATIGVILGLVEAFLYNIFARLFGGIKIDIEKTEYL